MDTVQWSQESRAMNTACGNASFTGKESNKGVVQDEKHGINCRRCSSTNTKFCYYNNYSLSQPRYFCKTCKRYWTEGGSLRNIPVGGVSRKNMKRISSPSINNNSSDSSSSPPQPSSKKMLLHHNHYHDHNYNQYHQNLVQVPRSSEEEEEEYKRQDLNLGLIPPSDQSNMFKTITDLIQVPDFDKNDTLNNLQHPNCSNYLFMPTINASNSYHQLGSFHYQEDNMMRRPAMLFPFQEIKQVERKTSDEGGYRINGGVLGSGLW